MIEIAGAIGCVVALIAQHGRREIEPAIQQREIIAIIDVGPEQWKIVTGPYSKGKQAIGQNPEHRTKDRNGRRRRQTVDKAC